MIDFSPFQIRRITEADDSKIAAIIRRNLEKFHLNLPGTVYFDPELDHLSEFYNADPEKRAYFILTDNQGEVVGGVGFAEFDGFENCVELQKLYLTDATKGYGLGKKLMQYVSQQAHATGYQRLYLETHSNLETAVHIYHKLGFQQIEKPDFVRHSTMDLFFIMDF
jgi:putative acetyltransferase